MLEQHDLFHASWIGDFRRLALEVTVDEAMLFWLNGQDDHKEAPNENYARELMELFTLGADRGAYTEQDVRELARVLAGYHADHVGGGEMGNFRFEADRHDGGTKTLWAGKPHARTGAFGWSKPGATWECDMPVDEQYPSAETPQQALDAALASWGTPPLTTPTHDVLLQFATAVIADGVLTPAERSRQRAKRQNALRFLVALSPDHHTC